MQNRVLALLVAMLLALSLAPAAFADPPVDTPRGAPDEEASFGRGPDERGRSADAPGQILKEPLAESRRLAGRPRNDAIEDIPVVPGDASIALNLIPYHDVPARLRALQDTGRVAVEIIGESVQGRPLYLAVATAPGMTDADWAAWQRLSDLRTEDPAAAVAAFERGEYEGWRSPLFINNNIHGNEWEGTDGSLNILDRLATAEDAETLRLLDEHLLVFVISQNPDGRVNATRANANGFDMNRDFITASQPETRIVREQLIRYDALTMLDQHGYVACTLIEPTTGPHGENYEYDLYIRNALRNALAMERAVVALGETRVNTTCSNPDGSRRIRIPFRNNTTGWDDWPPIFTPMYAMYHGTVGHTVEFPHNPRGVANVADRHDRTRINTRVVEATNWANFLWANENRMSLLADQLELFRRGAAGESSRPIDDPLALSLAAGDNADTLAQDYPRAYVIPMGEGQRSASAAARLVSFLLDNDVQVHRATRQLTLDGMRYAAGSYVVDMHQAKRGLANTILDAGRDVSDLYPTMYDISAWSQALLWGASVTRVSEGTLAGGSLTRISDPRPTGELVPGRRPLYGLTVDSHAGVQAVNELLASGVELTRLPDGTFVVPGSAFTEAQRVARTYGVAFTNLPPARDRGAVPVRRIRVGFAGPSDEIFALQRMGFDVRTVNQAGFNNGTYAFEDFDAFYVSATTFNPLSLNAAQQAAFNAWKEAGGAVVMRGGNGLTFNTRANLLPGVTQSTAPSGANGIVRVVNDPASPITGTAPAYAFMDTPRVWNVADESVRIDQRLADGDFFVAGHWRGSGISQAAAAGRPVVVSGTPGGANAALFATEPLYRAHPEGLHLQVAEALWRAGR